VSKAAVATALAALCATALFVVVPQLRFAYHGETQRVALETAAALSALLAAYIVLGRFLRSRRRDDLVLSGALALLAVSNLGIALLLALHPLTIGRLATSAGTLTGAALLAAAAYTQPRPVRRPARSALRMSAAALVVLALASAAIVLVARSLQGGTITPGDAARPDIPAHTGLLALQLVAMIAFAAAAVGFARRAASTDDPFFHALAIGVTLAAFARVHYFLYPPFESDWVYSGDLFRLGFYLVLLVAAAREIEGYWVGLAQTAVLEERRRIARDLHDGVAQELAFIGRRARRLGDDAAAEQVAASAERALADSRRAIAALTRPLDEPLDQVLAQAVEEVASRSGVDVALELDPSADAKPAAREALVRIACEAVTNAARHGHASTVRLELAGAGGNGVRMRVVDDGTGFDPGDVEMHAHGGFGLISMRERAHALGGELHVRSQPGTGTEVEVELP
jgi:signal transduction histidine kinase